MSGRILDYGPIFCIQSDLRRKPLKGLFSLEKDIENHYKMFVGKLTDAMLPSVFNYPLCDHISQQSLGDETVNFYKMRIKVTNPMTPASSGGRLLFAVLIKARKFVPICIFMASEEGTNYSINTYNLPLTRSGFKRIIEEKLKIFEELLK